MFSLSSVGSDVRNSVIECLPVARPVSPNTARSLPMGNVVGQATALSPASARAAMQEATANTINLSRITPNITGRDIEQGKPESSVTAPTAPTIIIPSSRSLSCNFNLGRSLLNGAIQTVAATTELAVAGLVMGLPAAASAASAATGHAIMNIHHDGYDVSEGVKAAVTGSLLVGAPSYVLGRLLGVMCGIHSNSNFKNMLLNSTIESFGGAFLSTVIGAAFIQNELGGSKDVSLAHHCLAGLIGGLIIGSGINGIFNR